MGCHTWFCRPITEEERQQLRSTSKESIKRLLTITDDKWLYDKLIQSIENGLLLFAVCITNPPLLTIADLTLLESLNST